jgi:hypothetical protein
VNAGSALRSVVAAALVIVTGAVAGTFVRSVVDAGHRLASSPLDTALDDEALHAAGDRSTLRFVGTLADDVVAVLPGISSSTRVLVVLRGSDTETCEDLGRQLRDLDRAVSRAAAAPLTIVVDAEGEEGLRRFLRRERLPGMAIVLGQPGRFLADGRNVGTPAAMIVDTTGAIISGVSHPTRFSNLRRNSFAEELGLGPEGSQGLLD